MTQHELDNHARALRADSILKQYNECDDAPINLIDLLADFMHWCDRYGVDFYVALDQAGRHYSYERNAEQHDDEELARQKQPAGQ